MFSDTDLGNSKMESFVFPKIVGNDFNVLKKLSACSCGIMEIFEVDIKSSLLLGLNVSGLPVKEK